MVTFAAVRKIFVICVVLLQLFTSLGAEAKSPVKTASAAQQQTKASLFSSPLHHDWPAELTHTANLHWVGFKVREQRSPINAEHSGDFKHATSIERNGQTIIGSSPTYLPLKRLLLFPKHYFW